MDSREDAETEVREREAEEENVECMNRTVAAAEAAVDDRARICCVSACLMVFVDLMASI